MTCGPGCSSRNKPETSELTTIEKELKRQKELAPDPPTYDDMLDKPRPPPPTTENRNALIDTINALEIARDKMAKEKSAMDLDPEIIVLRQELEEKLSRHMTMYKSSEANVKLLKDQLIVQWEVLHPHFDKGISHKGDRVQVSMRTTMTLVPHEDHLPRIAEKLMDAGLLLNGIKTWNLKYLRQAMDLGLLDAGYFERTYTHIPVLKITVERGDRFKVPEVIERIKPEP